MKTMTCKQMGGPCDTAFQAETADEIMDKGGAHVIETAEQGDEEHKKVKEMMDEMQTNPASGEEWNKKFHADFDALPQD